MAAPTCAAGGRAAEGPPPARELEVLRAVARGPTNRQAASVLHLGEATTKTVSSPTI